MAAEPCLQDLHAVIEAVTPRALLALGPEAGTVFDAYAAKHAECAVTRVDGGDWRRELDRLGGFDLAFVRGVLEHLPKGDAIALLGRLRDRHARRLYVLLPMGESWPGHASVWEQNDLIGLGMERAAACAEGGLPLHLYRFDIHTYKTTPDWLNSRYWAHPELWDKR